MRYLLIFTCSLVLANLIFYISPKPYLKAKEQVLQNDYSSQAEKKNKFSYRGPVDDCLLYHSLYDRSKNNLTDCTLNYVHYYPAAEQKIKKNEDRSGKDLKIGSFNLFHLGDNQAPMKSISLMADIINQWDIVGVQEMMPLSLISAAENQKLSDLLTTASSIKFPFSDWSVVTPGYLQVLNELQKIDSSWALILQSTSEGEGGSGEMAGFFYRSSLAQLKEWDYCPYEKSLALESGQQRLNLGCLTQVSDSVKKLTSRLAFAAYFQSGNFDFIGLTTHSRFRPSMLASDIAAQKEAICSQHFQPKKCKIAKDQVGRFYEIFAVAEQMGEMKEKAQDADVIFMGDFNLELAPNLLDIWKAALRPAVGFKPFQQQPTTVGIKFSKMVSSYDHFIANPKFTTECDLDSATAFDFVKAAKTKSDKIGQQINKFFTEKRRTQLAAEKQTLANSLVKVDKSESGPIVRALTDSEKADALGSLDVSLERMKFNEYSIVLQLISDHVPISMSCRKDLPDDD